MKKVILLFTIVSLIFFVPINSFALENTTFSDDDIKTIQNDSIVPRKILVNSNNTFKLNQKVYEGNEKKDSSLFEVTLIGAALATLFLIFQIIMVVLGKIKIQDLVARVISAIIMNVLIIVIVGSGIAVSNTMTNYFGDNYNFNSNTIKAMQLYVTSVEGKNKILNATESEILTDQVSQIATSYSGLTGDVFCLKTIQDQYRVANLVLNWITVALTYLNWLILLIADILLKVCFMIAPIIGYLYILGDKFSVIGKFWTIFWDSALAKTAFYLTYTVIFNINKVLAPGLTNNIINLEYALFTICSLIALAVTTFAIRDLFKIEGAVKVFSDKLTQISNKLT